MNTNKRVIVQGKEAREKLFAGAKKLADVVTSTLGPAGRNVIIGVRGGTPVITNDGVSIAKEIFFEDEIEDLGARTIREVAQQTNESVGDGTTTAITLAQAIIKTATDKITPGGKGILGSNTSVNPIAIKKQIDEECEKVCEYLTSIATPITDQSELFSVALVSGEHQEIAIAVSETLWAVGKDGFVTYEENYGSDIDFDVIDGMRLPCGYAAEFMSGPHGVTHVNNAHIVITNHVIDTITDDQNNWLVKLCAEVSKRGSKQLVIVATTFSDEVMGLFYANSQAANGFQVIGIRAPWAYQNEWLEDLASYTGGRFINKDLMALDEVNINMVGICQNATIKRNESAFLSGGGLVDDAINTLEEKIESSKDESEKKRLSDRVSRLRGKVGLIKVGATTLTERKYYMDKIEDTIHATRAAWQDGVIPGSGLALKEASKIFNTEDSILKEAILAPYNQIQENAGGSLEVEKWVVDPVRVTTTALKKACSVAGVFITASAAINTKFEKPKKEENE